MKQNNKLEMEDKPKNHEPMYLDKFYISIHLNYLQISFTKSS